MSRLSESEVDAALRALNQGLDAPWRVVDNQLEKRFWFSGFVAAFGFMAQVALLAEAMNHHPDWSNSYRRVDIRLSTHEVGGLSELDFELARRIERLNPHVQ